MIRVFKPILVLLLSGLLGSCATDGQGFEPGRASHKDTHAAEINVQLGAGYLRQGQYERALSKLERALEYDDQLVSAHSVIALVYGEMGEDSQAEQHFARALQLAPNDAEIHNNYGTYLCHHRRLDAAMKEFEAAWTNPRYRSPEVAYANAGSCARYIPDNARAEQLFRRALQFKPKYPLALFNMADLMFDHGDYEHARIYLLRYELVAPHTARSLWLGIRNEEKLNNKAQVEQYREMLLLRFPDSDEARLVKGGGPYGQ